MSLRSANARLLVVAGCCLAPALAFGQSSAPVDPAEVRQLIEQNQSLQQQINAQQKTIDELRSRISAIDNASSQQNREIQDLRTQMGESQPAAASAPPPVAGEETIRLSGEMGFAYFDSGPRGAYSNGEFRVDDAKVFLDAAVWNNVYLHVENDLVTREAIDENYHFGELYADIEGVSGSDRLLNLRVGRMYIPFGEEYEVRGVMENPLVEHSVSDIWGMDQGVEAYGGAGPVNYAVAVQDGGLSNLHNAHKDKSVAGRLGYDPTGWLHLSGSGMRTGDLSAAGDADSALWFGNTLFRPLGPLGPAAAPITTGFWANLGEADAAIHWQGGHLKGAAGLVDYDDNSSLADDTRHLRYYYIEAVQRIADNLSGALRWSTVRAPGGFPLVGQGSSSEYASVTELTTSLSRLSMGMEYQFAPPVALKFDFSPEWGQTTTGDSRDKENQVSSELGLKF